MKKWRKPRHRAGRAKQNRVWPVVLAAAIVTVVVLAAAFGRDAAQYFRARSTQDALQEMYKGADAGAIWNLLPRAIAEEEPASTGEEWAIHDDFAELYAQNPHLAGWLSAGEDIDYPVVQHDNAYYLDHDYFGASDVNGTLFINAANRLEPRDSILLIHGHNMKSGAMFGNLDMFREYSYLCEHPLVTFRTVRDAEDVYYVPIAAFDASMDPEAYGYFNIGKIRFDFDLPAEDGGELRSSELEAHIARMREMSLWDSPVEADSTDEFIILVTCSYSHDDGRMMLVCRALRDGERADEIAGLFR